MDACYTPKTPDRPYPIVLIGAGGIVKDAHLPAYRKAGLPVWGACDLEIERAEALRSEFGFEAVFDRVASAVAAAPADAVYDIAVPASAVAAVLEQLPEGAHVLVQKPMGENMEQARAIRDVCRRRKLAAAVNCQLRYAPFVTAARRLIAEGRIGELIDVEMRLTVYTPWHLFTFLEGLPRVEILYHSIHYIDLIRSFLGDPRSVMARTVSHPDAERLASVRSALILDYADPLRATVTANHLHKYGAKHQESYLKWEGTRGAIKARVGLLMDYPRGAGDRFEYCEIGAGGESEWRPLEVEGTWFPDAFIGTMAEVQRHKAELEAGADAAPMPCGVGDVMRTMACVEAAYASDRAGGVHSEDYL